MDSKDVDRYYIGGIYDNNSKQIYINEEGYTRGFLQECILVWSQTEIQFDLNTFLEKEFADGKDVSPGTHSLVITAATRHGDLLPFESVFSYTFYPVTSGEFTININGGTADRSNAAKGELVTIQAEQKEHYIFSHWTVNSGNITLNDVNSAQTSFVMGNKNVNIIAHFTKQYNIIVEGGTADKTISNGEPVSITATVLDGQMFERWEVLTPGVDIASYYDETTEISFRTMTEPGAVVIRAIVIQDSPLVNPFQDIYESDEYYNAVLWAYYADPQITNGMDETHFGPQLTVTRGQAVTFLWRSHGCLEPSSLNNPFVDVPTTEYYYKPILWAVEKGITKGVDETHFNPMDTLSTQHMVTFLYRTAYPGQDGWNGEAAAWAADENGRPFGIDIAVNNTTPCPRCNVVLFLAPVLAE